MLFSAPPDHAVSIDFVSPIPAFHTISRGGVFALTGLVFLLIWFAVYPTPLLDLIGTTLGGVN
jgi:hypothetical protein